MNQIKSPKEVVIRWAELFNCQDAEGLKELYAPDAINFQVPEKPLNGKDAIYRSFKEFFQAFPDSGFKTVNLFEDDEWAILEWDGWGTFKGNFLNYSPSGKFYTLKGCGFFHVKEGVIIFQRGYWDKATWYRQIGIPIF
ncbi:MAG: ester cyclase [Candidatus Aminicenantaceae bacterium]